MKLSPVFSAYNSNRYDNVNKNNLSKPSFQRIKMSQEDYDKFNSSQLKNSEKDIVLTALEKSREKLEEMDGDIVLRYRPKEVRTFWENLRSMMKPLEESLYLEVFAINRSRDVIPEDVELIHSLRRGDTSDDMSKLMVDGCQKAIDGIKKSFTYQGEYGKDEEFYRDNTGHWDLTDAYIP